MYVCGRVTFLVLFSTAEEKQEAKKRVPNRKRKAVPEAARGRQFSNLEEKKKEEQI